MQKIDIKIKRKEDIFNIYDLKLIIKRRNFDEKEYNIFDIDLSNVA